MIKKLIQNQIDYIGSSSELTLAKKMAACRFYRDPLRAYIEFDTTVATRSLTCQHTSWWIMLYSC